MDSSGSENKSIARALRLLCTFSETHPELTLPEIEKELDVGSSSAHRLVRTLLSLGFLEETARRGVFRLGLPVLELAKVVLNTREIRKEAAPHLQELAKRTEANANLGMVDRGRIVYLYRVPSPRFPDYYFHEGRSAPVNCTALGKAIVAFWPKSAVQQGIIESRGLPRTTRFTVTDPKRFFAELAEVRQRGFSFDDQEHMIGTRGVAAPVRDGSGRVLAAISISSTGTHLDASHIMQYTDDVVATAMKVSVALGYSLYSPSGNVPMQDVLSSS